MIGGGVTHGERDKTGNEAVCTLSPIIEVCRAGSCVQPALIYASLVLKNICSSFLNLTLVQVETFLVSDKTIHAICK